MLKLTEITRIYFLGIGGIGMSAIARYFHQKGIMVSGYDKSKTPLTKILEEEGIAIHYEDDVTQLDKEAEVVIYTPAIKAENKEYTFFLQNNYILLKRSDILSMITDDTFNICIAGTHGKTTISTMIAHILRDSRHGCNAFLGGISVNYETNYWSSENEVSVVEADEYDRSFLKLKPDIAVISSMDADHLEIYGDKGGMEQGFIDFTKCIRKDGLLIYRHGLPNTDKLQATKKLCYSLHDTAADVYAANISISNGAYHFDVIHPRRDIKNLVLKMGGLYNVENAVAAVTAAIALEIDESQIINALANFKGIKRRFEYIIPPSKIAYTKEENGIPIFIDDYAHHPRELKALIEGVREIHPGREVLIIFQPHLFSRTKEFALDFAASLDLSDKVILLPIYPARETPLPGVTSEIILDAMKLDNKFMMTKNEILQWINSNNTAHVIVTAGAGDIDQLVEPIRQTILMKYKK